MASLFLRTRAYRKLTPPSTPPSPLRRRKSLVAGRPADSPLTIRVARGSDVRERHELALVELCIVGDDARADECITAIYRQDDDVGFLAAAADGDMAASSPCEEDDGTECMLDAMWGDWSEGLMDAEEEEKTEVPKEEGGKKKVAPWSSRSSPSGTYVRNPKTGKMENIDE